VAGPGREAGLADPARRVGRHARPRVPDADRNLSGGREALQHDRAGTRADRVQCVDEHVEDGVPDDRRVAVRFDAAGAEFAAELDPRMGGDPGEEWDELAEDLVRLEGARLRPGRAEQPEEAVHECVGAVDLLLQDAEPLERQRRIPGLDPAPHELRVDHGRVDRILDLVRQLVGDAAEQVERVRPDLDRCDSESTRPHGRDTITGAHLRGPARSLPRRICSPIRAGYAGTSSSASYPGRPMSAYVSRFPSSTPGWSSGSTS